MLRILSRSERFRLSSTSSSNTNRARKRRGPLLPGGAAPFFCPLPVGFTLALQPTTTICTVCALQSGGPRASSMWLGLVLGAVAACEPDSPQPVPSVAVEQAQPLPNPYEDSPSRFGEVPLHAGFSPDPRVVSGTALGEVRARTIHRKCQGWVSESPDYLLDASTAFLRLYILGRSRSDVLLVVRRPDGSVLCNDNRRGTTDPMIRASIPLGTTQVWVGVQELGVRAAYRLGFSEVTWKSSAIAAPDGDD